MFRVTVLYPKTADSSFDIEYYGTTHVELVREALAPYGVVALEWDQVIGGRGGSQAPYYVASYQLWKSRRDFQRAVDDGILGMIAEDVPNFYNEHSVVFFSTVSRTLDNLRSER